MQFAEASLSHHQRQKFGGITWRRGQPGPPRPVWLWCPRLPPRAEKIDAENDAQFG